MITYLKQGKSDADVAEADDAVCALLLDVLEHRGEGGQVRVNIAEDGGQLCHGTSSTDASPFGASV